MGLSAATKPNLSGIAPRPGDRRKHVRFDMHFPVVLRAVGEAWTTTETADVSASGAAFVTWKPYLLNTPVEYVLTFPPELTKAAEPLRMRFFAVVTRCERIAGRGDVYGVAVHNTAHRYLTKEEALGLNVEGRQDAMTPPDVAGGTSKAG